MSSATSLPLDNLLWRLWPARWLRQPGVNLAFLLAGDTAAAGLAFLAAVWLWTFTSGAEFGLGYLWALPPWLLLLIPGWLILTLPLYDLRRAANPVSTLRSLFFSAFVAGLIYVSIFFFFPRDALPRLVVLYNLMGAALLTLIWRLVYIVLLGTVLFQRRLLVLGAGWAGRTLLQALQEHHPGRWRVAGLVDDAPDKHGQTYLGVPVLGDAKALLTAAQAHAVTDVVLAIRGALRPETVQALLDCQSAGLPVIRMPALYEEVTGRVPIDHIDADWVEAALIEPAQRRFWYAFCKRGLDVAGAGLGLALMTVVWPFIALAIALESGRPFIFRQTRLGQGGRPFTIYKFRTMVHEAEADGQARWALPGDDRVTRVGRFLRRTRLDESPQFINVLLGEMSLVGPRPERPEFTAQLEQEIPFFRARLLVQPGLTGWAQVNYGYAGTVADAALKLQWDLFYIKRQSLWLDLLILFRTIPVVVGLRGT